jgi:hypothetical protein
MRARGERAEDYGRRRLWQAEAHEATEAHEQRGRQGLLPPIPCPIACTCPRYPFPHLHERQISSVENKHI